MAIDEVRDGCDFALRVRATDEKDGGGFHVEREMELGMLSRVQVRLQPEQCPIFLANIFGDLSWDIDRIECVRTVLARTGNPVMRARRNIEIVRFKT